MGPRLPVAVWIIWIMDVVSGTSGSFCTPEQISSCQYADASGTLGSVPGGGTCRATTYVDFTHVCTVSTYLSGVDFCCCVQETELLCCRYLYQNKVFYCDRTEDVITRTSLIKLEVLLPALFGSLIVLVLVIICIVKCVQGRREVGDSDLCCCFPGWKRRKTSTEPEGEEGDPAVPLNTPPPERPSAGRPVSSGKLLAGGSQPDVSPSHTAVPSAPPALEDTELPELPPYNRSSSEPLQFHPHRGGGSGADHPYYRSHSANGNEPDEICDGSVAMEPGRRGPLGSIPEAPPSYDEHHHHPLFHPEENGANWF